MLKSSAFYQLLKKNKVSFFTGVPDSLLKDFCAYVTDHCQSKDHIIAANEGGAVALAAGHYLATGKAAAVYLQNSGMGNTVNPLLSLADTEVYRIPMLLIIGWRGQVGVKDEPQHVKQGRVSEKLLEAMEIPFSILTDKNAESVCRRAFKVMNKKSCPYAILVPANTFEKYKLKKQIKAHYPLSREEAIQEIAASIDSKAIIVSTTGKASRELFEYRQACKKGGEQDFLTVGSMGHCSQIAMGIAVAKKKRSIYCLDGDGAVLMHMGSLGISGTSGLKNYKHIVINNGAHESVGGQPTVGFDVSLAKIAKNCGYAHVMTASTRAQLKNKLKQIRHASGPCFLEVRVNKKVRSDLGRPTKTPIENKKAFMKFLQS